MSGKRLELDGGSFFGAGVGLEVKLSRHLGFYVDPTLKYYFKGTQPPSLRTVQPLMVDVNAGFRFDIP